MKQHQELIVYLMSQPNGVIIYNEETDRLGRSPDQYDSEKSQ